MKNLLRETEEALRMHGYTWYDVVQVQGEDTAMSVHRFRELADIEYWPDDMGLSGVAQDLVVMMRDGSWFDRYAEYEGDGTVVEAWRHHRRPDLVDKLDDFGITRVVWDLTAARATPTLARMNGGSEEEEEASEE